MRRCFQKRGPSGAWFWNIEQGEQSLLLHYGRSKRAGDFKVQISFEPEVLAERLIEERLQRGYEEEEESPKLGEEIRSLFQVMDAWRQLEQRLRAHPRIKLERFFVGRPRSGKLPGELSSLLKIFDGLELQLEGLDRYGDPGSWSLKQQIYGGVELSAACLDPEGHQLREGRVLDAQGLEVAASLSAWLEARLAQLQEQLRTFGAEERRHDLLLIPNKGGYFLPPGKVQDLLRMLMGFQILVPSYEVEDGVQNRIYFRPGEAVHTAFIKGVAPKEESLYEAVFHLGEERTRLPFGGGSAYFYLEWRGCLFSDLDQDLRRRIGEMLNQRTQVFHRPHQLLPKPERPREREKPTPKISSAPVGTYIEEF